MFQLTNYGAPDAGRSGDYSFYRTEGTRGLFNRTETQQLTDADLPPLRRRQ